MGRKGEAGIREALDDLVKAASIAIRRLRLMDLTTSTVELAEQRYLEICVTERRTEHPERRAGNIYGACHFDGHDAGNFTCLKMPEVVPWGSAEESKVLKCEPLDRKTMLASQEWMEVVFEPYGDVLKPSILDRVAVGSYSLMWIIAVFIAVALLFLRWDRFFFA